RRCGQCLLCGPAVLGPGKHRGRDCWRDLELRCFLSVHLAHALTNVPGIAASEVGNPALFRRGSAVMRLSVPTVSLAFLAVHLAIAAWVPLFDDEAYYALWARDLALGYYDHPSMIAYMIRMGTSLFGETALGIRL